MALLDCRHANHTRVDVSLSHSPTCSLLTEAGCREEWTSTERLFLDSTFDRVCVSDLFACVFDVLSWCVSSV